MKRLFSLALLIAVPLAFAQEKPVAKEPAKPVTPEVQAAVAEKPAPVARKVNPRRAEDARHCLDKGSNTEVIKCAEAYL